MVTPARLRVAVNKHEVQEDCMGILSWAIFGLIAGALAKWIMPGKDPGGIFITMLLGIAGALVGGFLGSTIGLGAVLLLWIYRKMKN
jgi:uncharacterized membrane protein YeaQ/YmgE (transglycosylase-associated protein family)